MDYSGFGSYTCQIGRAIDLTICLRDHFHLENWLLKKFPVLQKVDMGRDYYIWLFDESVQLKVISVLEVTLNYYAVFEFSFPTENLTRCHIHGRSYNYSYQFLAR